MELNEIDRPESEALEKVLQKEIGNQDRSVFVSRFLKGTAEILQREPRQYLSYGPYWWPLKRLLISAGYSSFGTEVLDDFADTMSYEKDELTIVACWAYSTTLLENGSIYSAFHVIPTKDGEGFDYELGDDEFEMILFAQNMENRV